jgi:hypothetical protein
MRFYAASQIYSKNMNLKTQKQASLFSIFAPKRHKDANA